MSRLPNAQDTINTLPIATIKAGETWLRSNGTEYASPVHFSKSTDNRFTSLKNAFGTGSLGDTLICIIAESTCRNAAMKSKNERVTTLDQLKARGVYSVSIDEDLSILDLCVSNLANYGLDARITSERNDTDKTKPTYEYGPAWADHAYKLGLSGIIFPSRHYTAGICLALFGEDVANPAARRNPKYSWALEMTMDDDRVLKILEEIFDWGVL